MNHDLQTLRLFVTLCETKSLTRAAERMNIAISAASRRIRLLEADAGGPLVRRLPHGVEPTAAGQTALRYARGVLRLGEQFAANMEEHRSGVRGRVRVFASSSALVQQLAIDLADFARDNPDIKIDLEERPTIETLEALARKQADIGVVVGGMPMDGLTTFPYARDRLAVAMNRDHALAGRSALSFETILNEDMITLDETSAIYRLLLEEANKKGRFLKLRVRVRSFDAACQMVSRGLGICVMPEEAARPLAKSLDLALVPLRETWARRDLHVCLPADEDTPGPAMRLVDLLRAKSSFEKVSKK
jgi:DNA-binding transcriptional LysR family regulator